ncbi:hypothetical protein OHB44_28040 [Micromonospora sp. NBC_00821]|uniref:hypothetical protein n=1 Tax=Micromonospora sp. NBC_00821 TaxID=2975977 RepID=UPI002ED0EEBA|nr:hypothetical protein OHB44_28040 [Micromonospora sp. NBC_00821]
MAHKAFADGDVLTAAEVNTYLMNQAVIVCTSGTRPSSPPEGMVIYETDTDLIRVYTGSTWALLLDATGWVAYTPTWTAFTSNPVLSNGTIAGRYKRIGTTVHYTGQIEMGSTTTYGVGGWLISTPTTAASATLHVGSAVLLSAASSVNRIGGSTQFNVATNLTVCAVGGVVSASVPFTWAVGDRLRWSITYETT